MLELGVFKGGSILMWGNYFKNGTIVGIDINNLDIELPPNVHFELGDQRDKQFLQKTSKNIQKVVLILLSMMPLIMLISQKQPY